MIDTITAGSKTGEVLVTYPDGSSEVVVVHVEVKNANGSDTQATNATIATQVQEVPFGTSVNGKRISIKVIIQA